MKIKFDIYFKCIKNHGWDVITSIVDWNNTYVPLVGDSILDFGLIASPEVKEILCKYQVKDFFLPEVYKRYNEKEIDSNVFDFLVNHYPFDVTNRFWSVNNDEQPQLWIVAKIDLSNEENSYIDKTL